MNNDAISRQAVNKLIDELARAISDERCFMSRGRSTATIMQDILDLPSVSTEKTGRWIDVEGYEGLLCKCSICCKDGERYKHRTHQSKTNYCPDCGAKMEAEE